MDKVKPVSAVKLLLFVLGILVGLYFVWLFTGGPERETSRGGAFIKPPAPLDSGEVYQNYRVRFSPLESD